MRFQVLADGRPKHVELVFGSARDLALVDRWRIPISVASRPGVRDTLEFARLASTATNLETFRSIVTRQPEAEVSLILAVRADWFPHSRVLGLAQCRRTYCNHLILEFLSVHPAIVGGAAPLVRGTGAGLVYSLTEVAGSVGIPLIWGEATAHSAPFYAKTCRLPKVQHHFFLRANALVL